MSELRGIKLRATRKCILHRYIALGRLLLTYGSKVSPDLDHTPIFLGEPLLAIAGSPVDSTSAP